MSNSHSARSLTGSRLSRSAAGSRQLRPSGRNTAQNRNSTVSTSTISTEIGSVTSILWVDSFISRRQFEAGQPAEHDAHHLGAVQSGVQQQPVEVGDDERPVRLAQCRLPEPQGPAGQ